MLGIKHIDMQFHEPLADRGAREVLGMSGSLRGYIETSNPKHPMYYHRSDKFVSTANKRKEKDKTFIKTLLGAAAGTAAVLGAAVLLKKGGGVKGALNLIKTGASGAITKVKGLFTKTPPTTAPSGSSKLAGLGTKIKGMGTSIVNSVKSGYATVKGKIGTLFKKSP